MIIDAAAYVGRLAGHAYPPEFLEDYAQAGVVNRIVFAQLDRTPDDTALDEPAANAKTLHLAGQSKLLRPLYLCRAGAFDSNPQTAAGALATEPFVGMLFTPGVHGYSLDDRDRLTVYFEVLRTQKKPAMITLVGVNDLTADTVYSLARHWADQPIVLSFGLHENYRGAVLDGLRRAADRGARGVCVDTAGAGDAAMQTALDNLGPERVLFATGGCPDGKYKNQIQERISRLRTRLPDGVWTKLSAGNAQRIFGLDQ